MESNLICEDYSLTGSLSEIWEGAERMFKIVLQGLSVMDFLGLIPEARSMAAYMGLNRNRRAKGSERSKRAAILSYPCSTWSSVY
jgi:hypothetical protein